MEQPKSADGEKESMEKPRPSTLPIAGEEFQQRFAVAQLAVRLCELEVSKSKIPLQKENADPKKFLKNAWELIESAREHVSRPQTEPEYLVKAGGSKEALKTVIRRRLLIPFCKLCDPDRPKGGTELIHGISWKVYISNLGFDKLFRDYWSTIGQRWSRRGRHRDKEIGTVEDFDTNGKPIRIDFYSPAERKEMAERARDPSGWEKYGQSLLGIWKRDGVRVRDFLALAEFRRKLQGKRAANLLNKPNRKRRAHQAQH